MKMYHCTIYLTQPDLFVRFCFRKIDYRVPSNPNAPSGGCGQSCGSSGSYVSSYGSSGSYVGPLPSAPLGTGINGAYLQQQQHLQQPIAYVSGGSVPSYGAGSIGGSYQSAQINPPSGSSFYSGGNQAAAIGNIPPGYGANVDSSGIGGGINGLTPPPPNITPPSELQFPLSKQDSFDDGSMQHTEGQLMPTATLIQPSYAAEDVQKMASHEQSFGAYQEAQYQQQQQQQQYQQQQQQYQEPDTRIDKLEIDQDQVKTDVADEKSADNIASRITDSSEMLNKYEQSESEISQDRKENLKTDSTYQSESYGQQSEIPVASTAPIAKSLESSRIDAQNNNKIVTETNAGYDQNEENIIIESIGTESSDSTCNDPVLKALIESTLNEYRDNLDAARSIESKASQRFGGRFNSIVSDSEFAYVNWYGKRNCQLQVNGRHSLTWED
ncbi:hypothetical protein LOAG_18482 [Loa loa]|uniref:Ground-like domain-containing protein n=1 Tax=Loa loa TaxID=7209 RepID=A0A1S0UFM0_LOALO|nr:hypothetical protein LOAG_18482 [Loa loa]EJD74158.1 hypothetical protein LOAG_18482 [Loa loa]